jgi:hypothetical protein
MGDTMDDAEVLHDLREWNSRAEAEAIEAWDKLQRARSRFAPSPRAMSEVVAASSSYASPLIPNAGQKAGFTT